MLHSISRTDHGMLIHHVVPPAQHMRGAQSVCNDRAMDILSCMKINVRANRANNFFQRFMRLITSRLMPCKDCTEPFFLLSSDLSWATFQNEVLPAGANVSG